MTSYTDLNIIANNVAFSNAFPNIEPASYFNCYKGVQPGLLDSHILPGTILGTTDQTADSSSDLWNVSRRWRCQFHLGVFHEDVQTGLRLSDKF